MKSADATLLVQKFLASFVFSAIVICVRVI